MNTRETIDHMIKFSFVKPTTRRSGFITVELNPVDYKYPSIQELHNQTITYVKNPANGFKKIGRSTRLATSGVEKYVREIKPNNPTDLEFFEIFKKSIYDLPASGTFIDSSNKEVTEDYINSLINELTSMTMTAGRRTKRHNKRSAKKSKKNKRKSRRHSRK